MYQPRIVELGCKASPFVMSDTAARLEACKAAASVRDTNLTAVHPTDMRFQEPALTLIAGLPLTTANRYNQG